MSDINEWCLREAPKIADKPDFLSAAKRIFAGFGVSHVTYLCTGFNGVRWVETDYPQSWQNYYLSHNLYSRDPVLKAVQMASIITLWPTKTCRRDPESARFFKLAENFGVPSCGAVAKFYTAHSQIVVSLASELDSAKWRRIFKRYTPELYLCAATSSNCVQRFRAAEHRILSIREREVLQWAARGKTAWETAYILGLTEGTVNHYIRGAINKMEATSKLHCVVLAIKAGLLEAQAPGSGTLDDCVHPDPKKFHRVGKDRVIAS